MARGSCLAGQVAGPHGGQAGGGGLARTSGQSWHVRVGAAPPMAAPHMALGGAAISTATHSGLRWRAGQKAAARLSLALPPPLPLQLPPRAGWQR